MSYVYLYVFDEFKDEQQQDIKIFSKNRKPKNHKHDEKNFIVISVY